MRALETEVYRNWIDSLEDRVARARVLVRVDRLVNGNPGKHRNLPGGISELKSCDMGKKASSKRKSKSQTKTIPYDIAAHLRTPEEMAAYLDAWLAEAPDDAAGIARALGDIARAKGMSKVARQTGLSRESLYKALSEAGNPTFATVLKVAKALGVRLHADVA